MKAVVAMVALAAIVALASAQANFTGYVVTGQWDGRTVPNVQWALDVTRQDTEWRPKQELKLQQLIPTTAGDALSPSFSAWDEQTRTFFYTTWRNDSSASIWGLVIDSAVETSKPLNPVETRYAFPQYGATLVGLQVFNNNGALTPLAFFQNCTVISINYQTGATALFANVCNSSQEITTAIEMNRETQEIYIVAQMQEGDPARTMVTLNPFTLKVTSANIQALKNHNPMEETPFEMVWLPTLQTNLVFYTGGFDQLVYTEPRSGMTDFAIFDLAQYGDNGHFEFTADPFLEDDDMWTNAAADYKTSKIYFQCSDVEPDSGEITTTLCQIPIPAKIEMLNYVNTAIWPMTYGYVGMQYVQVVS